MRWLKQGTTVVMIGPAISTDGITPCTGSTLSTGRIHISKNHSTFTAKACTEASSGGALGNYRIFLSTVDSGTLGPFRIEAWSTAEMLPLWEDFMILPANVYNSLVAGSDYLAVDVTQVNGTAQTTAISVLTTGDLDGAIAGLSTLSTASIDNAIVGLSTLSTASIDNAIAGLSTLSTASLDNAIAGLSTLSTGSIDNALAASTIDANVIKLGGSTQSLTDIKDFADSGYDPSNHCLTDKSSYALTTAQHVLIQTGLSTLSTASIDNAVAGLSTVSTGSLDAALAASTIDANVIKLGGSTQSMTDIKDFADNGYNPSTHAARADVVQLGGSTQSMTDFKDFADAGYDPSNNKIDGVKTPAGVPKNTALSGFMFLMMSTDHVTPCTGLSPKVYISKDGGAFTSSTNAAAEVSNGWYKVNFVAGELNADIVAIRAHASTGADDRNMVIITSDKS